MSFELNFWFYFTIYLLLAIMWQSARGVDPFYLVLFAPFSVVMALAILFFRDWLCLGLFGDAYKLGRLKRERSLANNRLLDTIRIYRFGEDGRYPDHYQKLRFWLLRCELKKRKGEKKK